MNIHQTNLSDKIATRTKIELGRFQKTGLSVLAICSLIYSAHAGEGNDKAVRVQPGAGTKASTWNEATLPSSLPAGYVPPVARYGHAMAYDSKSKMVLMFGGTDNTKKLGDTWIWDGTTWNDKTPNPSPTPRLKPAMACDTDRQSVVLFGGFDSDRVSDTWEWTIDSSNIGHWEDKTMDSGVPPSNRHYHAMAYFPNDKVVVLFGGDTSSGPNGETWGFKKWDSGPMAKRTWRQLPLSASSGLPAKREGHGMAYDEKRAKVVMFGGVDEHFKPLNDTWELEYDSVAQNYTWKKIEPPHPKEEPDGRAKFSMAFYAPNPDVMFYGGAATGVYFHDTEGWHGHLWFPFTGPSVPGAPDPGERAEHAMAYDPTRQCLVMFGGLTPNKSTQTPTSKLMSDTWLFRK